MHIKIVKLVSSQPVFILKINQILDFIKKVKLHLNINPHIHKSDLNG